MVLMLIVSGMATALSVYYLLSGVFRFEPAMEETTIKSFGYPFSVLVFAACGPILVLKLWFADDGRQHRQKGFGGLLIAASIALFWSAALGVAATQTAKLMFANLVS